MSDPQEPITVTTRFDQGAALIALTGELDLHSSGVLGEAMDEVLAASPAPSAIDLDASGLSFADSAGLRALLLARNEDGPARDPGRARQLTGPRQPALTPPRGRAPACGR